MFCLILHFLLTFSVLVPYLSPRSSCSDKLCTHACLSAGLPFEYTFSPPLFSGAPATEWGKIRDTSAEPASGTSTVKVCPGCKPPGPEAISAVAFHQMNALCTHTKFREVHLCTAECRERSCVRGPGLSRDAAAAWEPLKTAKQLSDEGFFSAPPPQDLCAPGCNTPWRRTERPCLFLSGETAARVVMGEWICGAKCHAIRFQEPGLYYSATSRLIVTHQLLYNFTEHLYQGHSFGTTWNDFWGIARKIPGTLLDLTWLPQLSRCSLTYFC
jgi:hypothetical protein